MDLGYIAKAARLVGNDADAVKYSRLAGEVREAFNRKYFNASTCDYGTGSQTSNALPLFLDMEPEGTRDAVLANLIGDIREHGDRLTTAMSVTVTYSVRLPITVLTRSCTGCIIITRLPVTDFS